MYVAVDTFNTCKCTICIFYVLQALSIIRQMGLKPKRTMRAVLWTAEVGICFYVGLSIGKVPKNISVVIISKLSVDKQALDSCSDMVELIHISLLIN